MDAVKVALDARMSAGGVGRYARQLIDELQHVSRYEIRPIRFGAIGQKTFAKPFTPWGRTVAAFASRGAALFHGLHFELPRALRIPSVVTIPDLIPLFYPASMPSSTKRALFTSIVERSTSTAACVIAPSELTASALVQRFMPKHVEVVPIGVSSAFYPLSEEERASARAMFSNGRPYIASVSSGKAHKNMGVLYEVARQLGPRAGLSICCRSGAALKEPLISIPPLEDRSLRLFYGGAEAFVLPSIIEGYGLPVVESVACGTPVVCGPDVGAIEFCAGGAVIRDVTDAQALCEGLESILSDDGVRRHLSTRGQADVASLTPRRTADETAKVYDAVFNLRDR